MSRQLNSNYFTKVDSHSVNGFRYETVSTRFPGATIILVPNGDPSRPIAAVSFVPNELLDSPNCAVVSALMPRDSVPQRFLPPCDTKGFNRYFQAMMNEGDREMAFVITNLVDGNTLGDRDYVKIDILKSLPPQLNLTDYVEHGVNNVNEIRPSQSYAVRSDQTTNCRTMVLKGVRNAQGAAMSVGQIDEALRRGETLKKEENYFYINVIASQSQPEIASLLSDSTWVAADFFVRKIRISSTGFLSKGISRGIGFHLKSMSLDETFLEDDMSDDMDEQPLSMQQHVLSNNQDRGNRETNLEFARGTRGDRGDRGDRGISAFSAAVPLAMDRSISNNVKSVRAPVQQQSAWATGNDINDSQAGRITIGNRQITQIGNKTYADYIHTSPGEKLVLCFSVWHGMRSVPAIDRNVLLQESKLLIDDAQTTEQKILTKMLSKTFKSDDCCICFEPNPSMVLLRCTHQCLCRNCCAQFVKNTCPVCRQAVAQTLDVTQWGNLLK